MEKGAFREAVTCTSRGTLVVVLLVSLSVLLLSAIGNHRSSVSALFTPWKLSTEKPLNPTSVEMAMAAPLLVPTNTGTRNHSAGSSAERLNDTVSTPASTATHKPPPIAVKANSSAETLSDTVSTPNKTSAHSPPPVIVETNTSESKLLDGLLPSTSDEKTCNSRYQAHLYLKPSPHKPSPSLISKLRSYERLHRRCGPNSTTFKNTIHHLTKTHNLSKPSDCNYIVWMPANGLGNRMLSLAATFLYAMLTDRVLLVNFGGDMSDIFCDPFPNSPWILPHDFPHGREGDKLPTFEMVSRDKIARDVSSFVFVNLQHGKGEYERVFHCDEGQAAIRKVPVLFLRSDQYYAPSLFMIESFREELTAMFPERNSVFHHLGRYLYSPSDRGWKIITRFYDDNLSKADHKVGIQVRVFTPDRTPPRTVMEQILACTMSNRILPKIDENVTSMAVLVASLYKDYSENLTAMYSQSGGRVRVFQPSHEGMERSYDNMQNMKAFAEMYLLSVCDVLVTSGLSTFGYVAQSLGGVKPWIMSKTVGVEFRNPPCEQAFSMDPCYHVPPMYDCKRRMRVKHMSSLFPYMKRCEDYEKGVKMIG